MQRISYAEYYDKVYGGWIGKCVGGNIGADVENNKYLMDLSESEIFPEHIPPNDDLDLQILWLHVLEMKGLHLTGSDLAEAWEKHCWYPFNEYGYFLHNFERKIHPPVSGWYNNQFFSRSMGSPIRSEIWGMVAVGNPQLAMKYAYNDATLDHDTESVWAEQMLSAMEAHAFFEPDINQLIDFGLERIPESSILKQCIRFVRAEYAKGIPWQDARRHMLERFGDPDASKAVQNLGITILSLLYGEHDFGKTQLIALNCGYDTDCTCATAGAILGIIGGAGTIPEEWKRQAKDTFVIGIDVKRPTDRISDLATDTCRVGVAMSRTINPEIMIEEVPVDLDVDRIPTSPPSDHVEFTVDYVGKPEIDPVSPKELLLTVRNLSKERRTGRLKLEVSAECIISPAVVELHIPGRTAQDIPVWVQVNPETECFAAAVIIQAIWEENDTLVKEAAIGLATGQPYYVIGPFWDLYDTRSMDAESYYDRVTKRKARPRGAENFNNYVSLDRAYISEISFAELPEGRTYYAAEHKLPMNQWIGAAGPACLYLVQDLAVEEERDVRLMVGNNDAFRIWVNDVQVAESRDPWYWMPYNHDITVTLQKGKNRIVAKVIRRGRDSEFSLGYAKPKSHVRWIDDLMTVRIPNAHQ
jgi:hypothetical protein